MPSERPNVLLVTVDSLRADHVSAVADSPVETPGMDRVAEGGTVYTDAYAQGPFTTFSMPSLFTSRYPSSLQYVEFGDDVVGVTASGATTVTEALANAGYATAGFHSNPLLSTLFDFDAGFDVFDADLPFADLSLPGRLKLLTNKLRRLLRTHAYVPAGTITDRAASWLEDREGSEPAFLWTHYMDVHGPYQAKEGFVYRNKLRAERLWQKAVNDPASITEAEHEELVATYRAEVRYTDGAIDRLLSRVDAATDRPTLVVLTADHGEGFGEHGYYSHPHQVHDVLAQVPLLVGDPTGTVDDDRVERPTELVDVAPTVLAAAGVDRPDSFEGGVLGGEPDRTVAGQAVAVTEGELRPAARQALVSPDWKYVVDDVAGERRLLDRHGERSDGAEVSNADVAGAFRSVLEAFRTRDAASRDDAQHGRLEDDATRERLRELGYLE